MSVESAKNLIKERLANTIYASHGGLKEASMLGADSGQIEVLEQQIEFIIKVIEELLDESEV